MSSALWTKVRPLFNIQESSYRDMVWLRKKKLGFVYNYSDKKTYSINSDLDVSMFHAQKLYGFYSRIMRSDKYENNIFMKTKNKIISILFNVEPTKFEAKGEIKICSGDSIMDFVPVENDRLLILTMNGSLMLYSYSLSETREFKSNLLSKEQLEFDTKGEKSFTMSLCSKSKYVTICTCDTAHNSRLRKLIIYEIQIDEILVKKAQRDFNGHKIANLSESYFYALNTQAYLDDQLLIVGVQHDENHRLCSFILSEKEIITFQDPVEFHTENCFRLGYLNGDFFSIDDKGVLNRFNVVSKDSFSK